MTDTSAAALGAGASALINLIQLAAYALQAWGLFMMAKALKVERPWIAWVPLVQVHTSLMVAGKGWKWFLKWVGSLIAIMLLAGLASAAFPPAGFALIAVAIAGFVILAFRLSLHTARRLGRGQLAALGLFLFPVLFYPVFGKAALKKASEPLAA